MCRCANHPSPSASCHGPSRRVFCDHAHPRSGNAGRIPAHAQPHRTSATPIYAMCARVRQVRCCADAGESGRAHA